MSENMIIAGCVLVCAIITFILGYVTITNLLPTKLDGKGR